MKFYARQSINQTDRKAVDDVLQSDFLTQGPSVAAFETALSEFTTAAHASTVNSATSALIVAYKAVLSQRGYHQGFGDVCEKDGHRALVWVAANTFVSTASAARLCGAEVDFIDIDITNGNMCLEDLTAKLEASSQLPDIVVPVHFAGASVDMKHLAGLAERFGFDVVEDAAHGLGGLYDNKPIGSCAFSSAAAVSFHAIKTIATGEGGAVFTNDAHIFQLVESLKSHGVQRKPLNDYVTANNNSDWAPWYYENTALGFNFRMTEIQAALGTSQLSRIETFRLHKISLAQTYRDCFANSPVTCLLTDDALSAHHLMPVLLPADMTEKNKIDLFNYCRDGGFQFNVHYYPVNDQPVYFEKAGQCPQAMQFYNREISLPFHMDVQPEDAANFAKYLLSYFA